MGAEENGERVIAVTMPEIHGHVVYSLPAARGLAEKHDCRVDYWISYRAYAVADLLKAQKFVRRVIPDLTYPALYREQGPFAILAAEDPRHGYEAVYHPAFARMIHGQTIADAYCVHESVPCGQSPPDLPDGCPSCELPDGDFIVLAGRGFGQEELIDAFRWLVTHAPLPVVEVGGPGLAVAADLGAIDRTGYGFLEMAGTISRCRYFVGCISSPLAVADAFSGVTKVALIGNRHGNLPLCAHGPKNYYLEKHELTRLSRLVDPSEVSEEEWRAAKTIADFTRLQDRLNKKRGVTA